MDNSLGDEGHEALLWFHVDLSSETEASQYLFSYHMWGSGVGSLETFTHDVANGYGAVTEIPVYNEDIWIESTCFNLPVGFTGEIYFRAIRGATVYGDIAVDNVRVIQEACPGKHGVNKI